MPSDVALISARFVAFADEARGSSPLYAHLAPEIAKDRELLELLLEAPALQRRANLLFAAAHDLILQGIGHPVARYYGSVTGSPRYPDESAVRLFRDFCACHRDALRETIQTRQTQTNEVRRSAAFLPVFQHLCRQGPIALVEVGTSAGLNLLVDRYRYKYGDHPWMGDLDSNVGIQCEVRGITPPLLETVDVSRRIGIDTHPLDVFDSDDARWLMACVWPEQTDRQNRLRAALDIAREEPPEIVRGDALVVLGDILSGISEDLTICVFNSATLFYFSPDECNAFIALLDDFGRRKLHWLSLEGGAFQTFGAKLPFDRLFAPRPNDRPTDIFGLLGYARWQNGKREDYVLGRADMHGRWIEWERIAPWRL